MAVRLLLEVLSLYVQQAQRACWPARFVCLDVKNYNFPINSLSSLSSFGKMHLFDTKSVLQVTTTLVWIMR